MASSTSTPSNPPAHGSPAGSGRGIALPTATAITVANMVGTGVFTSLGFQVVDLRSGFVLLVLWTLGGILALCGALTYGELAASLPRSGGEFNFLGRIYHPAVGFMAGWASLTVGFAPPIALAAMAFGEYFERVVPGSSPLVLSIGLVLLVSAANLWNLQVGSVFQNAFTAFKILLVVVFAVIAFVYGEGHGVQFTPQPGDWQALLSAPFAISLLFVMYAYTGWNAATYVIDEVRDPGHTIPRALGLGTLLVTVLYVALNMGFLVAAPMEAMAGQVEVGHVVAENLLGNTGGRWMSALLCIALVSTISAMTWAGPRVIQVMGQDYALLRTLSRTSRGGVPRRAVVFQTVLVVALLLTSTFETVLVYTQLILSISSLLAVLGVFVLRWRKIAPESPYRTWGYPVTPLLFAAITLFTLGFSLFTKPVESAVAVATLLLGLPVYWLTLRAEGKDSPVQGGSKS